MYNIAVIGCGVIGVTTALEIQKKYGGIAKVTIVADKFSPKTTSDIAAGLWEPYLLAENDEEDVIRWSKATFDFILKLWKEGKAKDAGICLQPAVNLFNCKNYNTPKWVSVTLGYNELGVRHLESLSKQYNQSFTGGFMFMGFTWEPILFLPHLQKQFLRNGGTIIEKHVQRFNELEDFDVIVNCTGLEARNLSCDRSIVPIRGQVIRVYAPWQYITYLIQCDDDEDACYVIPNRDSVILGGTKQQSFDTTINKNDTDRILKNTSKINYALAKCKKISEVVGLRPSRYRVRLEDEYIETNSGKILGIVHNYGHGGAGITLAIGCAKDASNLVENVLKIKYSKL
ncbi:unnamed protein product [Ceutorhynchus assimilis]|uniref:FAD dependent oxidoreductase domain-containing protein n=1 Tax=Ceutorhynchus assimilis TaxID=467358 RepID=A0A9N9MKK8_9CUCU|nr:unnamed protein product [Ceutorhynchus assimilis]